MSLVFVTDSKPSLVPEPDSRPMQDISRSSPPTSFQLVISPVKMPAICSTVRSSTLLSLLTMMAIPSSATVVAVSPDSLSLSFLDESPISVLPFLTASMPVPEPVGSYVTVMPSFSFINCSLSVLMTFCIEVEPFVETVPFTSVSALVCVAPEPVIVSLAPPPAVLPQLASAVTLIRAVSAIAMIFFMLLLFILIFLPFFLGTALL